VLLIFLLSFGSLAQETYHVLDSPPSHELVIGPRLASFAGSAPALDPITARCYANASCVTRLRGQKAVSVYKLDGTLLATVPGPGDEWSVRRASRVHRDYADSIWVVDEGFRVVVLTPDYNFARDVDLPVYVNSLAFTEDGSLLVNGIGEELKFLEHPLHIFSRDGQHLRSFGRRPGGSISRDNAWSWSRRIDLDASGGIWVSYRGELRLEDWGTDGRLREVFVHHPPWFPARGELQPTADPGARPAPLVLDMQVDSERRAWFIVEVAENEWPPLGAGDIEERYSDEHISEYFDWIVHVIDLSRKRVLASLHLDNRGPIRFAAEHLAYGRVYSNGRILTTLLPLQLRPLAPSREPGREER